MLPSFFTSYMFYRTSMVMQYMWSDRMVLFRILQCKFLVVPESKLIISQAFSNSYYGSGCGWSLRVRSLSSEDKKLEILLKKLQKDLEWFKNSCVLWEICTKYYSIFLRTSYEYKQFWLIYNKNGENKMTLKFM